MKKLLNTILNLISVLIIVAAIFVLLTVLLTRQGSVPEIMGYSALRVMTGSMEPLIRTDSLIIVKKTDPSLIREEDVISYYSADPELKGSINTHRVVAIEQEGDQYQFTTKGDANALPDQYPASGKNLVGKVIFISYPLGVAVSFLSSPLGFVVLILLPLLVIFISNLIRMFASARRLMREEEEAAVREAVEAVRRRKQQELQGSSVGEIQQEPEEPSGGNTQQ